MNPEGGANHCRSFTVFPKNKSLFSCDVIKMSKRKAVMFESIVGIVSKETGAASVGN